MITHNENHAGAADRVFRMSDGVLKDLGCHHGEKLSWTGSSI